MVYRLTASLIFLLAQLGSVQASTSEATLSYREVPHVSHIAYNSAAANNAEAEAYHNLLVIDTQLDDYETLLAQVPSSTQVLLLEPDNATTVLTETLAAMPAGSVRSLQIVSHGRAGALQLGDAWLTDNSAALFEAWEHALADDTSEVLLYGCELAAGQHGQMFVSGLAQTLQSNVFASDDLTGSALLQGNWSLEVGSRADGTPLTGRSTTIFEDSGYKFTLQTGDIVVIPVAPAELTVSEAGDTATFSVSLSGPRPTSNVTVGFSFDPEFLDEAETTPGEVTFTPTDFDNSRAYTITVRGLDDSLADGDTGPFPVNIGTASEDDAYNRITKTEPQIINVDNDTADVLVVAPAGGLMVSESGGDDSFTVRLSAQPAPDTTVTVALTVRDINPNAGDPAATEAITEPTEVTFDETNWNIPNTVVVAGVDDNVIDGDQNFFVDLTVTSTPESPFAGLELPSISGLNEDDDAAFAGISVDPFVGIETNEDSTAPNATGSFTVVLNRGPRLPVSVPVQSNDSSEGVVVPPSVLVFTPANWDQPQTVVVRGVDDDLNDGAQVYTISVGPSSSDQAVYDGIDPEDVEVTNIDDDEPGFVINVPADPSVSEPDGALNIQVRLTVIPTEGVALPLSVSDPDRASVSPASLSFTPDNWDVFQTVTVTAINNNIDDDLINAGTPVTFDLVTGTSSSSDPDYSGLTTDDVTITYIDDDVAGIRASPQSGLSTTEDGGEASFTVVLETRPTTAVTINLGTSDTTEGAVVPPTSIVFTPDDWDEPQSVRVRGLDDNLDDGDIAYSITVEGSGEYSGVSTSVSVQNTDDDTAGVNVSPTDGLITSETGTSDVFNVVLTTTPEGSVTIDFTSSEPVEGSVEPTSITFNSGNWNQPQTVTVTGIDDAVADGNAGYQIDGVIGEGTDAAFLGVAIPSVSVVNIDDDTPGVTVTPTSLETIEGGVLLESCEATPDTPDNGDTDDGDTDDGDTDDDDTGSDADDSGLFAQACFRVVLNSRPQSSVTISLTSDDESEGTVSPGELAFTPVNWNEPQFVTVTAVDDGIVDADVDYTIVTSEVQSTDSDYSGLSVPDVTVTNFDNNASITVSPVELTVTEAPGEMMQATFEVNLDAPAPEGFEVVIDLRSSDSSQGTVSPETLRFSPADGINPKTVTVTAVNNNVQEGDTQFQIILDPADSPGNGYDGIDPDDVTVVNIDDDEAGISVRALASPLVVSEDGDTAELRLVLDSEPQAEVSIPVSVSEPSEGSLSAEVIIFNEENWNIEQALIVRGVDDQRVDADTTFTVNFGTVTTPDPAYQGQTPSPSVFTITNRDNDQAGINVALLTDPLETDENGGSGQFAIVLASQPADSVAIDIRSSDPSEAQPVPVVVTFTAENWNVPQTVNVLGIVDGEEDGDVTYDILFSPARSTDPDYSGLVADPISAVNRDRDGSRILVNTIDEPVTDESGSSATFELVLATEPSGNVSFDLSSSDEDEGTVSPEDITFTPGNFGQPQLVIVTGVDDDELDGDADFEILVDNIRSSDPNYGALEPFTIDFVNRDNESAEAPSLVVSAPLVPPDVTVPEGDSVRGESIHQFDLTVPANVTETVSLTRVGLRIVEGDGPAGGDFFDIVDNVELYLDRDGDDRFNLPDAPPIASRSDFTNPDTGLVIFELNAANPLPINDEAGRDKTFIVTFSMPVNDANLPNGLPLLALALLLPLTLRKKRVNRNLILLLVSLSLVACGGDSGRGGGGGGGPDPVDPSGRYQVILTRVDAVANDQGVPNNLPTTGR